MFRDMEQWNSIRQRVLRDGVSIRQIQRETGLHYQTIKKILSNSCPPPFACPARDKPTLVITQQNTLLTQLLPKHLVLYLKILDDALLLSIEMRRQKQNEQVPGF